GLFGDALIEQKESQRPVRPGKTWFNLYSLSQVSLGIIRLLQPQQGHRPLIVSLIKRWVRRDCSGIQPDRRVEIALLLGVLTLLEETGRLLPGITTGRRAGLGTDSPT